MKNTIQSKKQTNNLVSNSLFKEAVLSAKTRKRGLSSSLCLFTLFTMLSLCLAYVSVLSLIITVPFVIAPSYFAYYAAGSMDLNGQSETLSFFILFKAYFNRLFSGSFRIIIGFIKALCISFLATCILFVIFEVTIFKGIPEYAGLISSLNSGTETLSSALEKFDNIVSANALFGNLMFACAAFGQALASLEFIHHVAYSTPKLDFDLVRQAPVPMRSFHLIDKMVKKENRKTFLKEYFKATWFLDVLILLAFGGAGVLQFFVLKTLDLDQALVLGLAISFVLLLPLFNYLSEVFHILFARHRQAYEVDFTNFTLELLTKYQTKLGIDEKDASALREFLNKNTENKDHKNDDDKK